MTAAQLVVEAGAVVTALTIVLGVVWRVLNPHVRAFVAEQTAAARQLQPAGATHDRVAQLVDDLAELRRQLATVQDTIDTHDERLHELERRLTEHLHHAAVELSMLRAVCSAAGVEVMPRPPGAPRRRWYDDPDPAVASWEVTRRDP